MSDNLKLEYKIGSIEFKAEGSAEAVEQQRVNFMNAVLPAAVEAMVRTQSNTVQMPMIEAEQSAPMLQEAMSIDSGETISDEPAPKIDLSRTSLLSYLKPLGSLSDPDFTLFAAYFDEVKNGVKVFSIENVKQYYLDGRRPAYSNYSALLRQLVKKGYIMDAPVPEGAKAGKYYMLTDEGLNYVREYTPKEHNGEKKATSKTKKTASKTPSIYSTLNADDLNIANYPAVKSLSGAKQSVIMAMYIVTKEGKGEWFTVDDVIYLMINIFEIHADSDMVNGVFKRNKSMFFAEKDPNNQKAYRRKLLSAAKDLAEDIIKNNS